MSDPLTEELVVTVTFNVTKNTHASAMKTISDIINIFDDESRHVKVSDIKINSNKPRATGGYINVPHTTNYLIK